MGDTNPVAGQSQTLRVGLAAGIYLDAWKRSGTVLALCGALLVAVHWETGAGLDDHGLGGDQGGRFPSLWILASQRTPGKIMAGVAAIAVLWSGSASLRAEHPLLSGYREAAD